MKYFTKEWFSGALTDEEMDKSLLTYWDYIDSIFGTLPFSVKVLSKYINLHDGIIQDMQVDQELKVMYLTILGGDLQSGYFGRSEEVTSLKKPREVLASELEMDNKSSFTHNLLLSDKEVLKVVFSDLSLSLSTMTAADYKLARQSLHKR